jgi:hypothetical protein
MHGPMNPFVYFVYFVYSVVEEGGDKLRRKYLPL